MSSLWLWAALVFYSLGLAFALLTVVQQRRTWFRLAKASSPARRPSGPGEVGRWDACRLARAAYLPLVVNEVEPCVLHLSTAPAAPAHAAPARML